MKTRRVAQVVVVLIFSMAAAMFALATGVKQDATLLLPAFFALVFGGIIVAAIESQVRSLKAAGERCKANVDAIAKALFDAPAKVRAGYDVATTVGATWGTLLAENNGTEFTTDGAYNGVSVSAASHASVKGRQVGEMNHTYSHVVVDVLGLERAFYIGKERASSKLARAMGVMKDATLGDAAFDKTFIVSTEDDFARDVLDESIRARLMDLQSKVQLVSQDYAHGGMNVLLSKKGLALRWPGDITPDLAKAIRDLLLDMRTNILAHEDRKAARAGASAGYRVAADVASPATAEPLEEPAEAEREARQA